LSIVYVERLTQRLRQLEAERRLDARDALTRCGWVETERSRIGV
jgi:hypothetical protein